MHRIHQCYPGYPSRLHRLPLCAPARKKAGECARRCLRFLHIRQDRIFEEFNTLSVIYNEPSERFVLDSARAAPPLRDSSSNGVGAVPTNGAHSVPNVAQDQSEESSDDETPLVDTRGSGADAVAAGGVGSASGPAIDLLGLEDALPTPMPPPVKAPTPAPVLTLSPAATLEPAAFQQQGGGLPVADSWQHHTQLSVPLEQLSARFAAKCAAPSRVSCNAPTGQYPHTIRLRNGADTALGPFQLKLQCMTPRPPLGVQEHQDDGLWKRW